MRITKNSAVVLLGLLCLCACTVCGTTTPPVLTLSDGTNSVTIDATGGVTFVCLPGACSTGSVSVDSGKVTWRGTIGVFSVGSSLGTTKPALVAPQIDLAMSVRTIAFGGGAQTLTAKWTDVDFDGVGPATMHESTNFALGSGRAEYRAYFDGGNLPFGTGTLVGTFNAVSPGISQATLTGPGPNTQPFSMTNVVAVTLTESSFYTLDLSLAATQPPPPLSLACVAGTAVLNTPYSSNLVANGGIAPYTFSLTPVGGLPPGLTLDSSTGVISGTPNSPGTFAFTAHVMDASGNSAINTVTNACSIDVPSPTCTLTATKTCLIPPPQPIFICKNAKPIDSLSMIWQGVGPVHILAWRNAKLNSDGSVNPTGATLLMDRDNIAVGDPIVVTGYAPGGVAANNDQYWQIFQPGSLAPYTGDVKTSKSTFHLSCSDTNMNGPEDCGKAQGNGKTDGTTSALNYVNDWIFDGMAGHGNVLSCTSTPPPPRSNCEFTKSNPSCKTSGKPTSLTFRYTPGNCASGNNPQGGKAQCSGSVDPGVAATVKATDGTYNKVNGKYAVNPSTVNPGDTFTVSASTFDADSLSRRPNCFAASKTRGT